MKYVAAPGLRVPLPGRAGQFVPASGGIEIDPLSPYFARLVADGDLIPAPETPSKPAPAPSAREGDK
ncbi:MAG: hypothetical protein B7X99_10105 [Rhizobiales bacterium 17-65-6]|nr:MAG: hypothetical protein B7Y84_15230 [Azorhizobium sp. 32-67-21]OYZ98862.1 MAG: hypothetical protein B7X99_10105 [Rhizobiales bacterium 17-65-6]